MKNLKKISQELRQVLDLIRQALTLNLDLVPLGRTIAELKKRTGSQLVGTAMPKIKGVEKSGPEEKSTEEIAEKEEKPKIEIPKPAVIKKN